MATPKVSCENAILRDLHKYSKDDLAAFSLCETKHCNFRLKNYVSLGYFGVFVEHTMCGCTTSTALLRIGKELIIARLPYYITAESISESVLSADAVFKEQSTQCVLQNFNFPSLNGYDGEYYQYALETKMGDCGHVLYRMEDGEKKVLGLHLLYHAGCKFGLSIPFTKQTYILAYEAAKRSGVDLAEKPVVTILEDLEIQSDVPNKESNVLNDILSVVQPVVSGMETVAGIFDNQPVYNTDGFAPNTVNIPRQVTTLGFMKDDYNSFQGDVVSERKMIDMEERMRIPARIAVTNWQKTQAAETLLESFPVTPMASFKYLDTNVCYDCGDLAAFGLSYQMWRGSLEYTFEICSTKFHQGQLYICYCPNPQPSGTLTYAQAQNLDGISIDVSNSNRTKFVIPFTYPLDFCMTGNGFVGLKSNVLTNAVTQDPINDTMNTGSIYIFSQNPLRDGGSNGMPTNVDINTYVNAGSDFEYKVPRVAPDYKWKANGVVRQSNRTGAVAMDIPTVVPPSYAENVLKGVVDDGPADTGSILDKPYMVGRFTVGTTHTFSQKLYTVNLPHDFADSGDRAPSGLFSFHNFLRCDFEVTIRLNTTPFCCGMLRAVYSPVPDMIRPYYQLSANSNPRSFNGSSVLPHCDLNLNGQTEASFVVPWSSIARLLPRPADAVFGQIEVFVKNEYKGSAGILNGTIWIRALNPHVSVKRVVGTSFQGPDGDEDDKTASAEGEEVVVSALPRSEGGQYVYLRNNHMGVIQLMKRAHYVGSFDITAKNIQQSEQVKFSLDNGTRADYVSHMYLYRSGSKRVLCLVAGNRTHGGFLTLRYAPYEYALNSPNNVASPAVHDDHLRAYVPLHHSVATFELPQYTPSAIAPIFSDSSIYRNGGAGARRGVVYLGAWGQRLVEENPGGNQTAISYPNMTVVVYTSDGEDVQYYIPLPPPIFEYHTGDTLNLTNSELPPGNGFDLQSEERTKIPNLPTVGTETTESDDVDHNISRKMGHAAFGFKNLFKFKCTCLSTMETDAPEEAKTAELPTVTAEWTIQSEETTKVNCPTISPHPPTSNATGKSRGQKPSRADPHRVYEQMVNEWSRRPDSEDLYIGNKWLTTIHYAGKTFRGSGFSKREAQRQARARVIGHVKDFLINRSSNPVALVQSLADSETTPGGLREEQWTPVKQLFDMLTNGVSRGVEKTKETFTNFVKQMLAEGINEEVEKFKETIFEGAQKVTGVISMLYAIYCAYLNEDWVAMGIQCGFAAVHFMHYKHLSQFVAWLGTKREDQFGSISPSMMLIKGMTSLIGSKLSKESILSFNSRNLFSKNITEIFANLWSFITDFYNALTGKETAEVAVEALTKAQHYYIEHNQRFLLDNFTVNYRDFATNVLAPCDKYQAKCEIFKIRSFQAFFKEVREKEAEYRKKLITSRSRMEPVGVWISGAAGCGKSLLMNTMAELLVAEYRRELNSEITPADLKLSIYALDVSGASNHFDGYCGQPVVVADDIANSSEPGTLSEVVRLISSVATPLPMASISEKGMKFNSKFFLATSNFHTVQDYDDIKDKDAVNRRFRNCSYVVSPVENFFNVQAFVEEANNLKVKSITALSAIYKKHIRIQAVPLGDTVNLIVDPARERTFEQMFNEIWGEYVRKNRGFDAMREVTNRIIFEQAGGEEDLFEDSKPHLEPYYDPSKENFSWDEDQEEVVVKAAYNELGQCTSCHDLSFDCGHVRMPTKEELKALLESDPHIGERMTWEEWKIKGSIFFRYYATQVGKIAQDVVTNVGELRQRVFNALVKGVGSATEKARAVMDYLYIVMHRFEKVGGSVKSFYSDLVEWVVMNRKPVVTAGAIVVVAAGALLVSLLWKYLFSASKQNIRNIHIANELAIVEIEKPLAYRDQQKRFAKQEFVHKVLSTKTVPEVPKFVTSSDPDDWCFESTQEFFNWKALFIALRAMSTRTIWLPEEQYGGKAKRPPRKLLENFCSWNKQESESIEKNIVKIFSGNQSTFGLLLNNLHMLVPKHYLYSTEDWYFHYGGARVQFRLDSYQTLPDVDAIVVRLPVALQRVRSIVKRFMKEKEFEQYVSGYDVVTVGLFQKTKHARALYGVLKSLQVREEGVVKGTQFYDVEIEESTSNGDCGIPYVYRNQLIGIHVNGTAIPYDIPMAGFAPVTYEMLQELDLSGSVEMVMPECVDTEETMSWAGNERGFPALGKVEENGVVLQVPGVYKSEKCKSLMAAADWPNEFRPAPMNPEILNKNSQKYLWDQQRDLACPTQDATDYYMDIYRVGFPADRDQALLTDDEILNGKGSILPLKRTSSAGHWSCISKKKEDFMDVEMRDDGKWYSWSNAYYKKVHPVLGQSLSECVEEREKAAKEGVRLPSYYSSTLKDELLPLEKCELKKTRVFEASPIDETILVRKYMGAFCAYMRTHSGPYYMHTIGIDRVAAWGKLYKHLKRNSSYGMAADYSKFDSTIPPAAFEAFRQVLRIYYSNGSEEEHRVRDVLVHSLQHSFHLIDGKVVLSSKGNKSGTYLTDLFNSFVNAWAWVTSFYAEWLAVTGVRPTMDDWYENVCLFTHGDDVIISVKPIFEWQNVVERIKALGFNMTDSTKKTIVSIKPVEELDYLKSSFRLDKEIVWCPFPESTVFRELNWCKRNTKFDHTVRKSMICEARQFAAWMGPKALDKLDCLLKTEGFQHEPAFLMDPIVFVPYEHFRTEVFCKQRVFENNPNNFFNYNFKIIKQKIAKNDYSVNAAVAVVSGYQQNF